MQFEKNIVMNNNVFYLSIPIDLVRYLEIDEKSTLVLEDEKGKKGKYVSLWVKEK